VTNAPDTYQRYETDYRDPELVAMMAIIDQLEEHNKLMAEYIERRKRWE